MNKLKLNIDELKIDSYEIDLETSNSGDRPNHEGLEHLQTETAGCSFNCFPAAAC